MSTLILPVAGQSSRFPNMRPKWLLTMPSGLLMIEQAVQGLDLSGYSRVIMVCLKEHLDSYVSLKKIFISLKKNIRADIEICVLDQPTSCHAETVFECLIRMEVEGPFYLKDCDNYFKQPNIIGNKISVIDLNNVELIDAKNKSYVACDENGNINNVVEKNVISNLFCCGGYSFSDSSQFLHHYEKIVDTSKSGEIYISHVIYSMLLSGIKFETSQSSDYIDFGTLKEYRDYCAQNITIFCDVDGVLLENGSKFGEVGWASSAIEENVKVLSDLQREGRIYLVVTTSRPDDEECYVRKELKKHELSVDKFIGGLPHSKRVLINDFSPTNPYPTAISINLQRNSIELRQMLEHLTA